MNNAMNAIEGVISPVDQELRKASTVGEKGDKSIIRRFGKWLVDRDPEVLKKNWVKLGLDTFDLGTKALLAAPTAAVFSGSLIARAINFGRYTRAQNTLLRERRGRFDSIRASGDPVAIAALDKRIARAKAIELKGAPLPFEPYTKVHDRTKLDSYKRRQLEFIIDPAKPERTI